MNEVIADDHKENEYDTLMAREKSFQEIELTYKDSAKTEKIVALEAIVAKLTQRIRILTEQKYHIYHSLDTCKNEFEQTVHELNTKIQKITNNFSESFARHQILEQI